MSELTLGAATVATRPPKGHSFQISDLVLAKSWAAFRDLTMVVRLDHGSDDEEYEEVLEFRAGKGSPAHFIIWNDGEAVFIQPMPGRMQKHASLAEALDHLPVRQPTILTDIMPTGWPAD
ncbi:MAG: hypothetical protein ACJ8AI_34615 [Rhodopila sp.]